MHLVNLFLILGTLISFLPIDHTISFCREEKETGLSDLPFLNKKKKRNTP